MNKVWMIACISDMYETPYAGSRLPQLAAPRYIHHEKPRAEDELLRLKKKVPDKEFVLLEAVAYAVIDPDGRVCRMRDIEE